MEHMIFLISTAINFIIVEKDTVHVDSHLEIDRGMEDDDNLALINDQQGDYNG